MRGFALRPRPLLPPAEAASPGARVLGVVAAAFGSECALFGGRCGWMLVVGALRALLGPGVQTFNFRHVTPRSSWAHLLRVAGLIVGNEARFLSTALADLKGLSRASALASVDKLTVKRCVDVPEDECTDPPCACVNHTDVDGFTVLAIVGSVLGVAWLAALYM